MTDTSAYGYGPTRDHNPQVTPVPGNTGPAWVAACYGVSVTDPCPKVTVTFPDWAEREFAKRGHPSRKP